ncbi:MAG: protocatechuate 3,4-dioxygenase subunit beta [Vicinamibacterales bacterium]
MAGLRGPPSGYTARVNPHPPLLYPDYKSTRTRAPRQPLVPVAADAAELSGPMFTRASVSIDADLTRQSTGEPLGEKIVVAGRVLDSGGRPVRDSLVELWQSNAAGRYTDDADRHQAPLDPHFRGLGRVLTDEHGWYRFITIKPGAYPWENHPKAWRPAHIHFSLFGESYAERLITQMDFPGDPLLAIDPIYNSVPEWARDRLISSFDLSLALEHIALGYRFDMVLDGRHSTPFDAADGRR